MSEEQGWEGPAAALAPKLKRAPGSSTCRSNSSQKKMRNDSPPSWIKEGVELHAITSSRELPRKGKVAQGPFKGFDKKWKVLLQFPEESKDERKILEEEEVVECRCCSQACPAELGHLSDVEARQRATKLMKVIISKQEYYTPELLERAIDSVKFPYGLNDVIRKVQEMVKHAQLLEADREWDKGPGMFKLTKGMTIRKCWYNGFAYDGQVVSTKPTQEFIDGRWQATYAIAYDNDEGSDLLTEQEIRMHRYPKPEMPSVLGRKFCFLELFSGERGKVSRAHGAC